MWTKRNVGSDKIENLIANQIQVSSRSAAVLTLLVASVKSQTILLLDASCPTRTIVRVEWLKFT